MKATKLNTTLALLSTAALGIFLYDTLSGLGGKRGRILTGLRANLIGSSEKLATTDKKLVEIANSIETLNQRLSKIEESVREGGSGAHSTSPDARNYSIADRHRYDDELFTHGRARNMPGLSDELKKLEDALESMSSGKSHVLRPESHRRHHSSHRKSSPLRMHHHEISMFEPLDDEAASLHKKSVPGLSNPRIIHTSAPISFADIIPDVTKDDPIVQVERFGEDVINHNIHENDGAEDTNYYRMSDILKSDKGGSAAKPAPVDAKGLKKEIKKEAKKTVPESAPAAEVPMIVISSKPIDLDKEAKKLIAESPAAGDAEARREIDSMKQDGLLAMIEKKLPKREDKLDDLIQRPTPTKPIVE